MKLSPSKIGQLFQKIESIERSLSMINMLNEREAAEILNIKPMTLRGYVVKKTIPENCYTVSPVNGERFYFKDRIMGLNYEVAKRIPETVNE